MIEADLLEPFARKLERLTPLAPEVRAAILSLDVAEKTFKPNAFLLREETLSAHCVVIVSGFACREKILGNGSRQILSFQMRGDGVGIAVAMGERADYNLRALTDLRAALIPSAAIRRLIEAHPQAMQAFWFETLGEAAIQREWTANIGRRDARSRVAHLLCEIAERQVTAGIAERGSFHFPFTQETLGDATGLTSVHINRTLGVLRSENVIRQQDKQLTIVDQRSLTAIAGFRPGYLNIQENSAA
ncbi:MULTISPECIES: Crp/Fnr family transcriptional regulator [unclassified Sphingomonas]|uniref:Crp/Fnr family transcriptional regulator n=1 Tax=unclassified Sphingomonas TaxID=196159 RepID=UPI002269E349|nr:MULTISPECIES: Crp/Fnr family transcriptional regulator [unclassified Sphingomonas]